MLTRFRSAMLSVIHGKCVMRMEPVTPTTSVTLPSPPQLVFLIHYFEVNGSRGLKVGTTKAYLGWKKQGEPISL